MKSRVLEIDINIQYFFTIISGRRFSDYRTGEQVITLGSFSAFRQYTIDYKTQNGGTVNKRESKRKEKY